MKTKLAYQNGAVSTLFVGAMVMFLFVIAFALDFANIYLVKGKLQNAVDSAALYGANAIYKNPNGLALYSSAGEINVSEFSPYVNSNVNLALTDNGFNSSGVNVQIGFWKDLDLNAPYAGAYPAVKVTHTVPVNLFFAGLVGIDSFDVDASAIAVVSFPKGLSSLPFAVSYCVVKRGWNINTGLPITTNGYDRFSVGSTSECGLADFSATISGDTLTVTNYSSSYGNILGPGTELFGGGGATKIVVGTKITSISSGSGGNGVYKVNISQNTSCALSGSSKCELHDQAANWTPLSNVLTDFSASTLASYIPSSSTWTAPDSQPITAVGEHIYLKDAPTATLYGGNMLPCFTYGWCPGKVAIPIVNATPCPTGSTSCPSNTPGTWPLSVPPNAGGIEGAGRSYPVIGYACASVTGVQGSPVNAIAFKLVAGCKVGKGSTGGSTYFGVMTPPNLVM